MGSKNREKSPKIKKCQNPQNPGPGKSRNFTPPKILILFLSKNFLPKLIFLRKGVHHPKSGAPAENPDFRGLSCTFSGSGPKFQKMGELNR